MNEPVLQPNIQDLLPHKGRMLLVDEILELDRETATTKSKVSEEWPLFNGKAVSPLVIVELVAQTCGLSNGLNRLLTKGKQSTKMGFLVGIKTAQFHVDEISLGTALITEATNRFKFETFREIEGTVKIGSTIIGEVTLQVMQAPDDTPTVINPQQKV